MPVTGASWVQPVSAPEATISTASAMARMVLRETTIILTSASIFVAPRRALALGQFIRREGVKIVIAVSRQTSFLVIRIALAKRLRQDDSRRPRWSVLSLEGESLSSIAISSIVFVLVFGSTLVGMFLRS